MPQTLGAMLPSLSSRAKPKSVNLARIRPCVCSSKMFIVFRSRWIMFMKCNTDRPSPRTVTVTWLPESRDTLRTQKLTYAIKNLHCVESVQRSVPFDERVQISIWIVIHDNKYLGGSLFPSKYCNKIWMFELNNLVRSLVRWGKPSTDYSTAPDFRQSALVRSVLVPFRTVFRPVPYWSDRSTD